MSNTTIVAVTNSYNDTVTLLPPSVNIEGIGKVLFHNNPRVEFDGVDNVTNFDHHVDFRISKNKLHAELIGDAYNHYPRLKRRTQYLNVFKFNQNRDVDKQITIPHYYMATLREGEHVAITNFGIPKCDKVVIKEQLGARGSNQVVVPTNMLTTLLKHSKGKTLTEVKEAFPDLIYTDNSNWDMLFFDNPNDLFISELITNVKSEYRLLVGGNTIYGRERTIKAGPYPQANLDVDKFHTVQEVNYERIEDMFDVSLVETLYAFAEYIDLPIGSIDLYSTTDGKWGIFEYSTQFAFHGANPNFIKQLLLDGVKKVLLQQQPQLQTNISPEGFKKLNEHMKSGGFPRGETVVIVGHRNDYDTMSNADMLDVNNDLNRNLMTEFKIFVDMVTANIITDRQQPVIFPILNVRYDSINKIHTWIITAGNLSATIDSESKVVYMTVQEVELSDLVSTLSKELVFDSADMINKQVDIIKTNVANIFTVLELNDPHRKYELVHSVHATVSKLTTTYNELLTILNGKHKNYHATHWSINNNDQVDWSYTIHAAEYTLEIKCDDKTGRTITINNDVDFATWSTNKIREIKNSKVSHAEELVMNMYTTLDFIDTNKYSHDHASRVKHEKSVK